MNNSLPSMAVVGNLLAQARVALAGSDEVGQKDAFTVLNRLDGAAPVAFLVAFTPATPVVVPLIAASNFIGRGYPRHEHEWRRPPLVEGAQWLIDCTTVPARVADARSSNGSGLLRSALWSVGAPLPKPLTQMEGNSTLQKDLNTAYPQLAPIWLGNPHPAFEWVELYEGDVLVAIYECFLFGWLT